jgi:hypothetical protein
VVEKGLSDIIVGRTFCSFWAEPNPKNERTADVYVQRERVVCVCGGGWGEICGRVHFPPKVSANRNNSVERDGMLGYY